MMPDIAETAKEGISRKIGPLPVWGWAIAVAGAVIGVRLLSGRPAFTPSSGTTMPNDTDGTGTPGEPGPSGPPGEIPDLSGLLDQIAGLTTGLTNANTFNTLQQRLIAAINTRATALYDIERWNRSIVDANAAYKDGKISKATYTSRMATYNKNLATARQSKLATDTLIADLQKQISSIGATT